MKIECGLLDSMEMSLSADLRCSGGSAQASWTNENHDSDSLTLSFSGGLFHQATLLKEANGFSLSIIGNFESAEFAHFVAEVAEHLNSSRGLGK